MRKPVRILLTGGGSGGHIIPNLAVASAIKNKAPHAELLYIGSRNKLDANLLKKTGIPFHGIFSGKMRRYFSWQNFIDPFFFVLGFFQSLLIMLRFWPQVVFSKGGYVSLPVVLAAFMLRRKIILHESDSRMGLANRLASKLATIVCVAFPGLAKADGKIRLTGNPIRSEIFEGKATEGYKLTGFKSGIPVLLVWGGSQGAEEINQLIEKQFDQFISHFQIIHITGAGKKITKKSPHYVQFEYLDDSLQHIYAITDLIIGRAGANSIYETAALQKPSILIPLKNADQLGNADYFEGKGAALVYGKNIMNQVPTSTLFDLTWHLWQNKSLQESMKKALGEISKKDAGKEIAEIILPSVIPVKTGIQ